MRIAQVAPLYESVPPRLYGGTERVVAYLTEELVAQGHEVTLFATGDSRTKARLVSPCPRALRLDREGRDATALHVLLHELVFRQAAEFDLIHFHTDYHHFPLSRRQRSTSVTTLHGRLDIPDLALLYDEFWEMPLVSISDAQRGPLPAARWIATVPHGLPRDLLRFSDRPGDHLAFLGRFSREKRPDRAIAIARALGLPLKLAAKIDAADREWFERVLRPQLDAPGIEYVGEITEREKAAFLGGARALLLPIDWPEPFGLVLIEAMACGTPVVAWRRGSTPEVLSDGVTGFLVDDLQQAIDATRAVGRLSRHRCREEFERRFTSSRMARDYVRVYERMLAGRRRNRPVAQ